MGFVFWTFAVIVYYEFLVLLLPRDRAFVTWICRYRLFYYIHSLLQSIYYHHLMFECHIFIPLSLFSFSLSRPQMSSYLKCWLLLIKMFLVLLLIFLRVSVFIRSLNFDGKKVRHNVGASACCVHHSKITAASHWSLLGCLWLSIC